MGAARFHEKPSEAVIASEGAGPTHDLVESGNGGRQILGGGEIPAGSSKNPFGDLLHESFGPAYILDHSLIGSFGVLTESENAVMGYNDGFHPRILFLQLKYSLRQMNPGGKVRKNSRFLAQNVA
jgi:hypothetical protein